MKRHLILSFAVALTAVASFASAGVNVWTTNGPIKPDGSTPFIIALAIDPSAPATLYAGAADLGGVFKSTDGGGSWTAINTGLTSTSVNALAIDPSTPVILYAGTSWGGVFKSANGGASWTAINTGLIGTYVQALAIDPLNPATLYAGTFSNGVFKSTDSGGTWAAANTGLRSPYVDALAVDPAAPATLYASTIGPRVFKSTDSGGTWSGTGEGPNDPWGCADAYALAIDPAAPATVYAGTTYGVYKSTNGGTSWTEANTGLTETDVVALAIDPLEPATIYAGTYGGGVFKSTNAGSTWTAFNAGLGNPRIHALAIDPSTSRLYAGTEGGVYDYVAIEPPCVSDSTTLCLGGGRFKVTTQWTTAAGQSGSGQAVALSGGDTGYFTFFDSGNVEVVVKVLNGCSSNGSFWIFAGGLTDVGVVMTVTDSQTGTAKSYSNPQGTPFRPIQDTTTFATCAAGATGGARPYDGSATDWLFPPSIVESFDERATEPCVPNATTLCLSNSRYQVRAQWLQDGNSGAGQVINLTGDTGAFWFFSPSNGEVVVKVLNACGFNSRYWTFAAGLTNVNVILTVTDTLTGAIQTYVNPQGTPFRPIQDTNAFATCP